MIHHRTLGELHTEAMHFAALHLELVQAHDHLRQALALASEVGSQFQAFVGAIGWLQDADTKLLLAIEQVRVEGHLPEERKS